ncbi:hypothetical protein HPA24_04345 [Streptococcus suis]|uniref:YopX family protein n=1 Tax=Streptococcus suis TaxID=1307 RepID=UPI0005CD209D|nr:YopX family protein [Streptococcus suis]MCK3990859.1 hypothetical protein [Streptococcus suis]MDE1695559.1 YopX family protein [Streptococcus suis]NQG33716.1 hypothetical protein [Streptococcus suis]NQL58549.1 hypothetical protein [Streptococcus suis]NQL92805.1 hypothetical protein [Streptococcus suis]
MIPKFRAWNTFHNKWVKHFYITENGLIYNMQQPHRDLIGAVPIEKSGLVVMQSTGLCDKNGKEIFEGDVVKCYMVTEKSECEYVGVVCLKDFAFVIVDKKDTYDPLWNYKSGFVSQETELEVISNIYENSELVEVE